MDIKQLEKIRNQYIGVAKKYNIFNQEFIDELLSIIILSPYSEQELSHEGGLMKYSLLLSSNLYKLNELLLNKYDNNLIIKLAILSNIGRYDLYKKNSNGKYDFAKQDITLKPNHKTIYLINKYNLISEFSEEDQMMIIQTILNGGYDTGLDMQYRYYSEPLTHIFRMASKLTQINITDDV